MSSIWLNTSRVVEQDVKSMFVSPASIMKVSRVLFMEDSTETSSFIH